MGKGDLRTKRGKINNGSFGNSRLKANNKKKYASPVKKKKEEKEEAAAAE